MKKTLLMLFLTALIYQVGFAQKDTVYIYGPGGPFSPINECAQIFSAKNSIMIKVVAGPEAKWISQAAQNADVICGKFKYSFSKRHCH
jgi:accessory colonization factor AcfC